MQKRKALQERTVQKVLERRTVQRRTLVQERNVQEVLGNVSLIILYIKLDHFFTLCVASSVYLCVSFLFVSTTIYNVTRFFSTISVCYHSYVFNL